MKLDFQFYNDQSGRLRCKLFINNRYIMKKPAESRDGKRYNIFKVFSLHNLVLGYQINPSDWFDLQLAESGERVSFNLEKAEKIK